MKRLILLAITLIFLLGVGIASADPGDRNPIRDMIVDVSCDDGRSYDRLYTVGLSPWFNPEGTAVSPGPTTVEVYDEPNGQWLLLHQFSGQGNPTTFCTWTRHGSDFRGDVQFAPQR